MGHAGEVQSFDGEGFGRPEANQRLERLFVEALLERADGSLWIAAREGLYRLQDGHLEDLGESIGITAGAHANTLVEDASGDLDRYRRQQASSGSAVNALNS
ncbi:MAG: hypothetical protein U5R48_13890 [Gammaproteobacteria bacterium]|nr:hypothetical protein [Gammaproteobacteria bacterium]